MALSNAIIPILPDLDDALHIQAFIFSAYFFGAMVTTLPGGILSDRIGQMPVIKAGLIITIFSGFLLMIVTDSLFFLIVRLIEGVGAGLFVSAGLSWINHQSGHIRLSGIFMALLNLGLLFGLIVGGWIASSIGYLKGGILIFTILTIIPSFILIIQLIKGRSGVVPVISENKTEVPSPSWSDLFSDVAGMGIRQAPLWFSVIILLGATGFVQAVYPDISNLPAFDIGVALAIMNLATVLASLAAPWVRVEPVLLIRISALSMGVLVLAFIQYPVLVFLMGAAAGFIMISQISYLAISEERQGIAMGLFSTSSYAGMTFLPAIGGIVAGMSSVNIAAWMIAALALVSAVFIGRCKCRGFKVPEA